MRSADRGPEPTAIDGLLARIAHGDARAFAAVYDQVAGAVYALVHRIIGNQAQAEQVAAEVLVEVWVSAARFSPAESSGLSWIITMARRRALNQAGATEVNRKGITAKPASAARGNQENRPSTGEFRRSER